MRKCFSVVKAFAVNRQTFGSVITALLLASIQLSTPAFAQTSAPSVTATQGSGHCPEEPQQESQILTELRELSLKPGMQIEPASFMKDPKVAQVIADMGRRTQLQKQVDWSGLCRYRAANAALQTKGKPEVIFLGDSITDNWIYADAALFTDKIIDRGISGQTSSQMLLRFYPDVVALHPKVVHIMAGTNDILQNTGPVGDDDIVNNISAMIDIAQLNGIKVVLASILPISVRSWQPDLQPAQRLIRLNQRLEALAAARNVTFIDYFNAMKDAEGGFNTDLANDGVHPNRAGYALMKPMALRAIEQALH